MPVNYNNNDCASQTKSPAHDEASVAGSGSFANQQEQFLISKATPSAKRRSSMALVLRTQERREIFQSF